MNRKIETIIFIIFSFFFNYYSYGIRRDIYYILIGFPIYIFGSYMIFYTGSIIRKKLNK